MDHMLVKGGLIKRYGKFSIYSAFDTIGGFLHSYGVYLDNDPRFEDHPSFATGDPIVSKDLVFNKDPHFAILQNGKTDIKSLLEAIEKSIVSKKSMIESLKKHLLDHPDLDDVLYRANYINILTNERRVALAEAAKEELVLEYKDRSTVFTQAGFVVNKDVIIHYLQSNLEKVGNTPLFICPGLLESAEDYVNLMAELKDNRCIVLSFRGRGQSKFSTTGYSLEDHVSDISAVVNQLELDQFCLMGYSRGVSYELGYAVHHHEKIKGLIIEEYPAEHKQMPSGWGKKYILLSLYERMWRHVLIGIELESRQVNFRGDLPKLDCPTLIMRGGNEGSLLSDDDVKCYMEGLQDVRLEVFEDAGHDIKKDQFDRFVKVISNFLKDLDKK